MQLKWCISWHLQHVRPEGIRIFTGLDVQVGSQHWDHHRQIHCGIKIRKKTTLRYKQLCLLPPRKCIYREMENRLACQSLSSTPDSHCKWRWPRPWTGRACRWDRRTPRRGPEHFQNPPLRPGAGSACAPSQHPAPAAQETAWRARTTQGETTEVCWINKEISLRFNLFT